MNPEMQLYHPDLALRELLRLASDDDVRDPYWVRSVAAKSHRALVLAIATRLDSRDDPDSDAVLAYALSLPG